MTDRQVLLDTAQAILSDRRAIYEQMRDAERERGFEIIAAIMADHRPEWWRICAPLMDAADIRKMQIAAQRRIKKILESAIDAENLGGRAAASTSSASNR